MPIAKSPALAVRLQQQFGPFVSATTLLDGYYDVEFANGNATALIVLGPWGKIERLPFQPQ